MTPFGEAVRRLRADRGISQKVMAAALGVSPAYLSALEHGRRGRPGWQFVQRVIGYFNIIWDEAEALEHLAELSGPRVSVDTSDCPAETTLFANRLAKSIRRLDRRDIERLSHELDRALIRSAARTESGD